MQEALRDTTALIIGGAGGIGRALAGGLAAAGAAVLVVLHDLTLAARYCDRLVLLKDGRIAASGPPSSVLTPANLSECFAILATQVETADGDFLVPVERISEPS